MSDNEDEHYYISIFRLSFDEDEKITYYGIMVDAEYSRPLICNGRIILFKEFSYACDIIQHADLKNVNTDEYINMEYITQCNLNEIITLLTNIHEDINGKIIISYDIIHELLYGLNHKLPIAYDNPFCELMSQINYFPGFEHDIVNATQPDSKIIEKIKSGIYWFAGIILTNSLFINNYEELKQILSNEDNKITVDESAWRKNKSIVSENVYRERIRVFPDDAHAHYGLGNILAKQHKYESAIEEYLAALKLDPSLKEAYLYIGYTYYLNDQTNKSLQVFNDSYEINKNDPEYWFYFGLTYYKCMNYAEAISCFKHVIEINPNHTYAYCNLGDINKDLKNYQESYNYFKKAKRLSPRNTKIIERIEYLKNELKL